MPQTSKVFAILMADDDEEDCMLTQDALRESRVTNPIYFVHDGEELMKFLQKKSPYEEMPRPGVILLDLNMPRKDGREALKEIKQDPHLRTIPIIVLTTSRSQQDIYSSYEIGANSYITKPVTFQALVAVMQVMGQYWFEIVELSDHDYPA
jgi:CheY-like chemotaxis protein